MTARELTAYLKDGEELPLAVKNGKLTVFRPNYTERIRELMNILPKGQTPNVQT